MQATGGDMGYISLMSPPTDNFGFFFTSKYPDAGITSSIRRDGLQIDPPPVSYQLCASIAICIDVVTTKDASPRPSKEDFAYFSKNYAYFA